MARKLGSKNKVNNNPQPQQNNPQPQPPKSADSDLNASPESVAIEVQDHDHQPEQPDSAWEKIKSVAEKTGLFAEDEDQRIETRGRKKKTAAQDEFSTLVISVLVLILSFSGIPETVKPNDAEIRVLANHLSGLMLRHLPISSKFSQDSLDIIGIFAVISGWYARVAPELKALQEKRQATQPTQIEQPKKAIKDPEAVKPVQGDPIRDLSPATSKFLDEVIQKANQNANNN